MAQLYEEKKGRYQELKEVLITDLENFIAPLRERRQQTAADTDQVKKILASGGATTNVVAQTKIREVRQKIGVI